MPLDAAKNFAKVTVSGGNTSLATSIALSTGHGAKLPTPPFNMVWWNATDYGDPSDDPDVEVVRCTSKTGDSLEIVRAQEGTGASAKNMEGKTYKMIAGFFALAASTVVTRSELLVPRIEYLSERCDFDGVETEFDDALEFEPVGKVILIHLGRGPLILDSEQATPSPADGYYWERGSDRRSLTFGIPPNPDNEEDVYAIYFSAAS